MPKPLGLNKVALWILAMVFNNIYKNDMDGCVECNSPKFYDITTMPTKVNRNFHLNCTRSCDAQENVPMGPRESHSSELITIFYISILS